METSFTLNQSTYVPWIKCWVLHRFSLPFFKGTSYQRIAQFKVLTLNRASPFGSVVTGSIQPILQLTERLPSELPFALHAQEGFSAMRWFVSDPHEPEGKCYLPDKEFRSMMLAYRPGKPDGIYHCHPCMSPCRWDYIFIQRKWMPGV